MIASIDILVLQKVVEDEDCSLASPADVSQKLENSNKARRKVFLRGHFGESEVDAGVDHIQRRPYPCITQ